MFTNSSCVNVEIMVQIFYLFVFEVFVDTIYMLYSHSPEEATK